MEDSQDDIRAQAQFGEHDRRWHTGLCRRLHGQFDEDRAIWSWPVGQSPLPAQEVLVAYAALPAKGHGRHSAALLFCDEGKPLVPAGFYACVHAHKMNAGLAAA